jgi:MFS family permease
MSLQASTIDARSQTLEGDDFAAGETQDTAWSVVLLLALILFGGAVMRTVFGPLQEAAKIDLGLSDFAVSLVQGLSGGAPVALISIPVAWVIDHGRRVQLLIVLLGICVIGTIWTAFATSFLTLFLARMLSSLGAGCAIAVIISLTADYCAPHHRGRAIVILGLGTYAGAAAAFVLGGGLLSYLARHPIGALGALGPWRGTHFLIGMAGTVLLFPLFLLREPVRHEQEQASAALLTSLRALWSKRRFLAPLFVGQLAVGMADGAAGIWATPVLIRNFHQQPSQFAGWMGGVILFAGIFGSMVGGFGADLGKKSGKRGALLLTAVAATALGVPAALFPLMPSVTGFALVFMLMMFVGTVTAIVSSTTVAVLIPNEERGACMAAFAIVGAMIGQLAPTVVAWGSSAMGGEQHLAPALAVTGVVTGVISFAGYIFAMRNAPRSATDWG